jgi:hypothetical protein
MRLCHYILGLTDCCGFPKSLYANARIVHQVRLRSQHSTTYKVPQCIEHARNRRYAVRELTTFVNKPQIKRLACPPVIYLMTEQLDLISHLVQYSHATDLRHRRAVGLAVRPSGKHHGALLRDN